MSARNELEEALRCYTIDTLIYIDTVRRFWERITKWMLQRESELHMMLDIKDRADAINLNISHLTNSEDKGKAFMEYMKSKVTQVTADGRRADLENELSAVLKETVEGLETLDRLVDAVEKLAVTSVHVFMEKNQVIYLPAGISLEHVRTLIAVAQLVCPLFLEFKRDTNVFFLPRLQNVQVLAYQLDKYIQTTQKIFKRFEKSVLYPKTTMETQIDLDVDLSDEQVQRMLYLINQLDDIRMNQKFRMVFLFQDVSCSCFIDEFSGRQARMLQFLKDLEESAVRLDSMSKGARISSVAGSSVGAIGGVLSIIGLALIPVTAGLSLALTVTGVGLGVTSGINSLVTTATETGVNFTQQKKVNEVLQSFMEDVQMLQDCLEKVIKNGTSKMDVAVTVGKMFLKVGAIGKSIDSIVDAASAVQMLKNKQTITIVGRAALQESKALRNVPRVASDIPEMGQAAVKGPLALTKSARVGLIAASVLFIGLDIFFICKDSISLAQSSKTKMSQFIRARAALLSSEIDSWQKIYDCLCEGLPKSEENKAILETPFYPEMELKKHRETEAGLLADEVDEIPKEIQLCLVQ